MEDNSPARTSADTVLTPPTPAQESLLRQVRARIVVPLNTCDGLLGQIVTAGLLDRVARRIPPELVAEVLQQTGMRATRRHVPYIVCTDSVPHPVFIHPHSSVYPSNPASVRITATLSGLFGLTQ